MYTKEALASGVMLRACSRFLSPHDRSLMVEAGFMCQMIFTQLCIQGLESNKTEPEDPFTVSGTLGSHLICFHTTNKQLSSKTCLFAESFIELGEQMHLFSLVFFTEENSVCTPTARDSYERLSLAGQALPPGFPSPFLFPDGLSSIETLLTNIQVLSFDPVFQSSDFVLVLWFDPDGHL